MSRTPDDRLTEEILRSEVEQLGRVVDEQDRTIARLNHELFLYSTSIGWRLQKRLDPLRSWLLRTPGLRQLYRLWYRALELWVDEGVSRVVRQVWHKIALALRGRDFTLEDRERVMRRKTEQDYDTWRRTHDVAPPPADLQSRVAGFRETPLVSVLTLLNTPDAGPLHRVVATLAGQPYQRWELCVAMPPSVRAALEGDPRVRAEARVRVGEAAGPVATWADAWRLATGDFAGAVAEGDELAPHALVETVARLNEAPDVDVIYSDEDAVADGRRTDPFFKPDWSPDLLLSTNYLEHFGLVRRRLLDEAGGFDAAAGHGQAYDLMLRVTERTGRIAHVPKVLYHARRHATTIEAVLARRVAAEDECRAIGRALERRGRPGRVSAMFARSGPRCYATRFAAATRPLVSIIIPTRDKASLLKTTIESIRGRSEYDRFEIIVVDNGSTEPGAVSYLASLEPSCQVHRWREPFNYSAINNAGVRLAQGEQLLFLNNDVEVIQPDWLNAMLEHAERPEVGAVGARLLYGDGRIQHAGVVVGINRAAANAFRMWPGESPGGARLADLTRNCSAVTGACMMVPRRVFDEVGGFDESLRVVLNDVDLCLRIRQKGYLVVYTPHALLYHYEGSSRGLMHPPPDQQRFEDKWPDVVSRVDPYYNPNLAQDRDDWSLRTEY